MSWGIADTAPEIEKIKAESADYLNGLNSCGVIDCDTYNYAFDFYMDLLNRSYEQGKKDASSEWIPCSERLPENEYVLISKKPTMISGDKWSVAIAVRMADPRSGKIQWRDSGFGVIQDDKVLAWMPLPEGYRGVMSVKTIDDLVNLVQAYLDAQNADGCKGCAFVDRDEWEMPCDRCKRNCRDYWRLPKEED